MSYNIPIIIICYNNYKYVDNTIKQIININSDYEKDIIILNNCSSCPKTIEYLSKSKHKIINNNVNITPRIDIKNNRHIYDMLPDKFILTDPDLQFNSNLPKNFIEILASLSVIFDLNKIGFALDISDFDKMYQYKFDNIRTILDYESPYWKTKYVFNEFILYDAYVDTTFTLVNKKTKKCNFSLRIAGDYVAKHLPWYIDNPILSIYEQYLLYNNNNISTISSLFDQYINDNYTKITKNNQIFFINNNDNDIDWFKISYSN